MELKMKLWTTSGQCRVLWADHDYSKALFRRADPSHFTNNDNYQVVSSQLGEWSAKNVCQDHTLMYLMHSFDFSVVQRDDLNSSCESEDPTVVERRTELYSMLFEALKCDDGLFAFSSSPLAQIGLRWLAFFIPV